MIAKSLLHYEILEKLGAGGMGEVYKALDTKLNREVALKILPQEMALDPDRRARFEREAQAVAALKHPNIVTMFSVEETEGFHFLTMELVEGPTLSEVIPDRGFSIEKFFDMAIPLTDAVAAAHAKGITHRDLKPANVMIDGDRRLKVLDFGLAKLLEPVSSPGAATISDQVSATQEGRILGTANYMSPEQAEGKPIDHRTDIFSLGIILYELATGERPFQGDTNMSTLSSIIKETPPPIMDLKASLPRHLNRIVQRCLAKAPDRRYQSALDVRNDLELLQHEVASGEHDPAENGTAGAPSSSRRTPWWAAVLFLAGSVAGAIALTLASRPDTNISAGSSAQGTIRFSIPAPPGQRLLESRISPDGRTIAFEAVRLDAGADPLLYFRRLDSEEAKPIKGTEGSYIGAFSPDGRWYAFVGPSPESSTLRLFKLPVDGDSPPLAIADWPKLGHPNLAWMDDDRIVAANWFGDRWFLFPANGGEPTSEIELKGVSPVYPINALADGRHLLGRSKVFEDGSSRDDIVVVDMESGSARQLVRNGSQARLSPSGHLVFSRAEKILAVPFDLDKLEVTGGPITVLDGAYTVWPTDGADFDLTPTGTLTYRPGGVTAKHRQLVIVNRDGSIENWGDPRPYHDNARLSLTRDGQFLAATLDANMNGIYEIWVSGMDEPRLRMLAEIPAMDCLWPVWSSDGKRLAYTAEGSHQSFIYVASLDQNFEPIQVMEFDRGRTMGPCGFTEDGSAVIVAQVPLNAVTFDILRVPVDTTQATKLLTRPPSIDVGTSPDGRWFCYISDKSGQNEVYVCEVLPDGVGPAHQVSKGCDWPTPLWRSPDPGTWEIAYTSSGRLMSVSLRSGPDGLQISSPRDLEIDLVALRALDKQWLPDGRFLILQEPPEDRVTRLNVVVNFQNEILSRAGASQ